MLHIKDLKIDFLDEQGGEAVKGISFSMMHGEILGLVGESGSGKTMTALTIAGLIDRQRTRSLGEIWFQDKDLLQLSRNDLRKIQGKEIGFIFQEPLTALNPLMKVGKQIEEPLRIHTQMDAEARRKRALEMMQRVELPEVQKTYHKYPHALSGGQRQRVMIAAAIIMQPKLLIADEPTTALDATIQRQILNLLQDIHGTQHMGILMISHDLGFVEKICDGVIVMRGGKIIEQGTMDEIFHAPRMDYTKQLISAATRHRKRKREG